MESLLIIIVIYPFFLLTGNAIYRIRWQYNINLADFLVIGKFPYSIRVLERDVNQKSLY